MRTHTVQIGIVSTTLIEPATEAIASDSSAPRPAAPLEFFSRAPLFFIRAVATRKDA